MLALIACVACVAAGAAPAPAQAATLGFSPPAGIDSHPLSAVSCPGESLCVAVDGAGNALSTTNPNSSSPSWSGAPIDPGQSLTAISCASASLCVAVDAHGFALSSRNPAGGAGAWSAAPIDPGHALEGVSCPSESLCVAVDDAGSVLTTGNPGPGAGWGVATIDAGNRLRGVSCSGPALCVAVDEAGNALGSENPGGGAGAWHRRAIAPGLGPSAVSCSPSGPCVAVDAAGDALASFNSGAGAPTWSSTPIDGGGHLSAISCAPTGLCVAVDDQGAAFASDRAGGALPGWSGVGPDPGVALTGVSCLSGGLCVAVDAAGRALTGRVPPPAVATSTPAEVTDTAAVLAGVINPNDAALSACWFEYGTSTAYEHAAPCASVPAPAGGPQPVVAGVGGLSPNTTYHYRLFASTPVGAAAGGDATFTTAVSSRVPLVVPRPSISGTPAVRQRLSCRTGIPSGTQAQVTYAWLRDLLPIPGASASSYVVKGLDSGHHIQCQVTTSTGGGNVTVRSAFVTIPAQGLAAAVGETSVGRAQVRGAKVSVPLRCSPRAGTGCRVLLRLTAVSGRRSVTLASVRVRLGRGQRRTVTLALNSAGRRLLAHRHPLPARLTVVGTVIGVIEASLAQRRLLLGASNRSASRDHGRTTRH